MASAEADLDSLFANGEWRREQTKCGGCIAALKGTEIHVHFTRPGVITRRVVREFLGPLLDELGFLTTRCVVGDASTIRFLTKLGFEPTWSDGHYEFFMLTRLPFRKEK